MTGKDPDDIELARWRLKYLTEIADDIKLTDLEWVIKMEASFNRKGCLSEKEMEILEDIYSKY